MKKILEYLVSVFQIAMGIIGVGMLFGFGLWYGLNIANNLINSF